MRRNMLSAVGLTMLLAAGLAAALIGFAASPAGAGGSGCSDATHTCTWNGNGTDASSCKNVTAGTGVLWIFTGKSTPTELVVTWSNGKTDTITGWVQEGHGSWHLQTNLVGSFPPASAYVDYTGTNGGGGATLTISGCNEGGPPGTTTTATTPTTTTMPTTTTVTTPTTTTVTTSTTTTVPTTTTVTTTTTVAAPAIHIAKSADAAQVQAGSQIGFTLTVYNDGGSNATGVKLSDPLPANPGLSWSIASQGSGWASSCAIAGGVLSCGGASGVTVAAGTSLAASTFTVHIVSGTAAATGGSCAAGGGVVSNTGSVTSGNAGSGQSSASTCVQQNMIDLAVTKSGSPDPDTLPGNITWKMVVTNNGPQTATGVTIADPIPAGNAFVSAASTQGSCTGGAILSCSLGTIASGGTVTITLVTTPSVAGTVTNTVTVVGNETETNTANNTASASVLVVGPHTPPTVFCVAVSTLTPHQLFVGRKQTLTIHLTKHGQAVKGVRVRIKGPKLNIRTKPSNAKGIIKQRVRPTKAGIVVFTPLASPHCGTKRLGVTGVFTPPVTG